MELPPRREQTQPILRILRYYQPSNVHCQRSTEDKKCTLKISRISTYLPYIGLIDEQMDDGVFREN